MLKKINLEEILIEFGIENDSTHPDQNKRDFYQMQKSILLEFSASTSFISGISSSGLVGSSCVQSIQSQTFL